MDLGIGGLGNATEIGAGASAIVYRARQLDLDREVAVKVLSVTDEAFVRRFAREAKMLGKLSQNPGIVTVYDTGVTAAGQPYLILELCESSVLDHLQGPEGRFDSIEACKVGAQVADAVSDAHNNGVIHRDIKPGNILRSQTGRYMITDFGISTVTGATIGQTNSVGFTAGYVAPETLSGETASTPADIYALGATLFHMLAGKPAYVNTDQQSNLLALAQRVINDPVPDLRPEGVPDEVCRIVEGAMTKRPQDRPTAAQLRDQLNSLVPDLAATPAASTIFGERPATMGANPAPVVSAAANPAPPIDPATMVGSDADATTAMDTNYAPPSSPPSSNNEPPPAATGQQAQVGSDAVAGPSAASQPETGVENGILAERTVANPAPAAASPQAPYVYDDDRRSLAPLLVGAVVGFLALLAGGAFLVSQNGDDPTEDGAVEAIDGSATSLSPGGDQSTNQQTGGSRGTLDPNAPTTETTPTTASDADTEIPSVVGQAEEAATSRLEALGFVVNVVSLESESETPGTVVRQSPVGNESGSEGSTVTIFVATRIEAEQVSVPDLRNKTLAEAETAITDVGLVLATPVTRQFHPTVPTGQVISSSPTANVTINAGSSIALVISDGVEPAACDAIAGMTQAAATTQLQAAGLTVTASPIASTTVTAGTVVSCTENDAASIATLAVSAGDVCGNATGKQLTVATNALETAGFTVTSVGEPSTTIPVGQVTDCTTNGSAATLTHATAVVPPTDCDIVEGDAVSAARTTLAGLGFTTIDVALQPSATVPDGNVISCAATAATANLVVSSGPPSTDVVVPDVVGDARAIGMAALRDADLKPTAELVFSDQPKGDIVATDPIAGTTVPFESSVTVMISDGPAPTVTVPANLIGQPEADVVAALTAIGLDPLVQYSFFPPTDIRVGNVTAVFPMSNEVVEVGTLVRVTVGRSNAEQNG